jgi:hypothetical protein
MDEKTVKEVIGYFNDGSLPRIAKMHMAQDFYDHVIKSESVQKTDVERVGNLHGLPLFVHPEPCKNRYWFEDQDGKIITPKQDNFRVLGWARIGYLSRKYFPST